MSSISVIKCLKKLLKGSNLFLKAALLSTVRAMYHPMMSQYHITTLRLKQTAISLIKIPCASLEE